MASRLTALRTAAALALTALAALTYPGSTDDSVKYGESALTVLGALEPIPLDALPTPVSTPTTTEAPPPPTTTTTAPPPPPTTAPPTTAPPPPPTTAAPTTAPPTTAPPTTTPPPRAPAPAGAAVDTACESAMASHINASRGSHGVPAVGGGGNVIDVARAWSAHMADTQSLYHNPNLLDQVMDLVSLSMVRENVGYSSGSVDGLYQLFMDSPSHRNNILATDVTNLAVGCVRVDGVYWVTHNFWG